MNKISLILCLSFLVGCTEKPQPGNISGCPYSSSYSQAVLNNNIYRDQIRNDYIACLKTNTNRDVVYNDTNELAKTCLENAHKLNGGIVPSMTTISEATISSIETKLRRCGQL